MGFNEFVLLGLIFIGSLLERIAIIGTVKAGSLELLSAVGGLLKRLVIGTLQLLSRLTDRRDQGRSRRNRLIGLVNRCLSRLNILIDFSRRRGLQVLPGIGVMDRTAERTRCTIDKGSPVMLVLLQEQGGLLGLLGLRQGLLSCRLDGHRGRMGIGDSLFDGDKVALETCFVECGNVLGDFQTPIGNHGLNHLYPSLPGFDQLGLCIIFGREQLGELCELGGELGILLVGLEPGRDYTC